MWPQPPDFEGQIYVVSGPGPGVAPASPSPRPRRRTGHLPPETGERDLVSESDQTWRVGSGLD